MDEELTFYTLRFWRQTFFSGFKCHQRHGFNNILTNSKTSVYHKHFDIELRHLSTPKQQQRITRDRRRKKQGWLPSFCLLFCYAVLCQELFQFGDICWYHFSLSNNQSALVNQSSHPATPPGHFSIHTPNSVLDWFLCSEDMHRNYTGHSPYVNVQYNYCGGPIVEMHLWTVMVWSL